MACRVGMSTTPLDRIEHWKQKEKHTWGEVVESGLTYDQAAALEKKLAEEHECKQEPGGPRNCLSNWSVYIVSGGTIG